jgi:hypothetical protein
MAHTKSLLVVAWQRIPTISSASVFHGSGPRWQAPISRLFFMVGRLNCCCPSSAQSFLASGLVETFDQDLFFSLLDIYVFEKWDLLFDEERGRFFSGGAMFVAL